MEDYLGAHQTAHQTAQRWAPHPTKEYKELEAQLAQAEERARQAEVKAKLLDTLIDVAEGEFGFEIRKKSSQTVECFSAQEKMSVNRSCQLFGYTRQAYYKRKTRPGQAFHASGQQPPAHQAQEELCEGYRFKALAAQAQQPGGGAGD